MTTLHDAARKALDALDRAISDDRAYIRECKDAAEAIRAHLAAQPAPVPDEQIDDIIRDVAELDYNSPEGMPDVMLVTADELRVILQNRIAAQPAPVPLTDERITKALRRAFSLGQTYWQQADSDSYKQNAKSDETRQKFETLIVETLNGITGGKP